MTIGSSPAITTLNQNSGYQIAYSSGGVLATYGTDGNQRFPAPVAGGTSPSITGFFLDGSCGSGQIGYTIAYDGPGLTLSTVDYEGGGSPSGVAVGRSTGLPMNPGSSPSITASNDHC